MPEIKPQETLADKITRLKTRWEANKDTGSAHHYAIFLEAGRQEGIITEEHVAQELKQIEETDLNCGAFGYMGALSRSQIGDTKRKAMYALNQNRCTFEHDSSIENAKAYGTRLEDARREGVVSAEHVDDQLAQIAEADVENGVSAYEGARLSVVCILSRHEDCFDRTTLDKATVASLEDRIDHYEILRDEQMQEWKKISAAHKLGQKTNLKSLYPGVLRIVRAPQEGDVASMASA